MDLKHKKSDICRLSFTCGILLVKRGFDSSPVLTIGGKFFSPRKCTKSYLILSYKQTSYTRNCVGVVVAYSLVNR